METFLFIDLLCIALTSIIHFTVNTLKPQVLICSITENIFLLDNVHFPRNLLSVSSTNYTIKKEIINYSIQQQENILELF